MMNNLLKPRWKYLVISRLREILQFVNHENYQNLKGVVEKWEANEFMEPIHAIYTTAKKDEATNHIWCTIDSE